MYVLNAHYMFALTTHCAETGEGFGPVPASIGITYKVHGGGGGEGGGDSMLLT